MGVIEQIKQKVKNQVPPAVIALGGSERALLEDALNFFRANLNNKDEAELNNQRFSANDCSADVVCNALNTSPFLAPRRVVELYDCEKLSPSCVVQILDYLENPSPTSVLLMIFGKLDKRSKLVAALGKKGCLITFAEPSLSDVEKFIDSEAVSHGLRMTSQAGPFLAVVLDSDLVAIKSALAKLALSFAGKEVSEGNIVEHIIGSGAQDVFRLAKLISEGNVAESLYVLGLIKQARENTLKFFGVLVWQFRTLLHIRHCLDKGMREWEIGKCVFVFGNRLTWMLKVAKLGSTSFHIGRLCRLLECDLALKSQKIQEPFSFIEKIIYQSAAGIYSGRTSS